MYNICGSQLHKSGNTGAGTHCHLFSTYLSLGRHQTSFDGEFRAITSALNQLTCRPQTFENAVILSDSKAAISATANYLLPPTDRDILQCRAIMRSLNTSSKKVSLQWIPSHCGIAGNDVADSLAKKGTHIIQTSPSIISYNRAAANIRY